MKISALFALAVLASAIAVPKLEAAPTVVYLVRHAEKATQPPDDPPLTDIGTKRAKVLAVRMAQAHPVAVIHTQFRRTRDTARPTVDRLNIPAILIPVGSTNDELQAHAKTVVKKIKDQFSGKTTLVVGHSDTVPAIIKQLGIPNPPTILQSQYNRIFKVTQGPWPWSHATMVPGTYGQ